MNKPTREEMLALALEHIAKLKPEPVADGFVNGPQSLLDAAKRIARDALKQSRFAAKPDVPLHTCSSQYKMRELPDPDCLACLPGERERTAVEQFQNRIVEMIGNGFTGFHLASGPNWHALSVEERCKFILQMWDARGTPLNFGDSRRAAALNGEAKG